MGAKVEKFNDDLQGSIGVLKIKKIMTNVLSIFNINEL